MRAYVIRRLLLIIPTLLLLTILVFLSVRFLPGDVIDAMLGRMEYDQPGASDREALERMLGLDVPGYVQYARWLGGIFLHGSLGESLMGRGAVEEQIIDRLPVTVELGLLAILIGLVIALPVGIYSAIRQDTAADYAGRSVAIIGLATPNFWLGIMVMIYPAIWWGWSPQMELIPFSEDPLGNLRYVPHSQPDSGDSLGGRPHAADAHHDAGGAAAGLHSHRLVEGAPGAGRDYPAYDQECLIPVVTLIGLQLPILIGGSVIMENIFNLPGLGRLILVALNDRDYPLISGINLFFATAVMGANLVTDLLYAFLDPRIRYQ